MNRILEILGVFEQISANPAQYIKNYIEKTGNKTIGCFPVYSPSELVHAAGCLPVGIWGGQTDIAHTKAYLPAFACSIMQSSFEFALKGTYDVLDAVIIPSMCDTLKCIGQNWKVAVPQVELITLVHPHNRKIDAGKRYLEVQYQEIVEKLEKVADKKISLKDIHNSIELFNDHRVQMRRFSKNISQNPSLLTLSQRHSVMKSAHFMDRDEHLKLVSELNNQLESQALVEWNGKRIILSGITAGSRDLLAILEECNFAVVGDDLAQESRQYRTNVPASDSALRRLAEYWSVMEGCSVLYDPNKKRGQMLVDMAAENKADGVIICMMKFCDPEEYDYPILKRELEDAGIPLLYLEIDQQSRNNEQARTRIQAFKEILNIK